MNVEPADLATFRLTGKRTGAAADEAGARLRPALFANYRDLSRLRHDYPLVLGRGDADGCVRSLSSVVDAALHEVAPPGAGGERLRKHLLGLEREIRSRVAQGTGGTLSRLWDDAAASLLARAGAAARESLQDSLDRGRRALSFDGELVACDRAAPGRVMRHVWSAVQDDKTRAFRTQVDGLVRKLSDILRADFMRSPEARTPDSLKAAVGTAFEGDFDFAAMSRMLGGPTGGASLPETRRSRIRGALAVLQEQRFFATGPAAGKGRPSTHGFVFASCAEAIQTFRARLPEMAELVKAMLIAELEIANRYREARHDPFFDDFDGEALAPDDIEPFPHYLVCLPAGEDGPAETAALIEILSSDLPIKVVVQSDDILARTGPTLGQLPLHAGGPPLARMAIGLGGAFVVQATASHLFRQREWLARGLAWRGPALFSLYSGVPHDDGDNGYLAAAAAMESRAFPAFAYDPGAGPDWASRFHVTDNPQSDSDWPVHAFPYEDEEHQRRIDDIAFTAADFVAGDERYRHHLAAVPAAARHDAMIPVAAYLELDAAAAADRIPYVLMIDEADALHRVVVDDRLVEAARRCRAAWRGLQELGGVHNSHAVRLLARERAAWELEKVQEIETLKQSLEPAAPAASRPAAAEPAAVEAEVAAADAAEAAPVPVDEPYIETPRCTTCNECTEINNRMFVYNENKQAYIADPDAGTFRQLVEAAENCQVSIIHPGKPRNPAEPDLDALIARAEPFN